eukprot:2108057-Ditylum_brightwellii.AAC.1
MLDAQDNRIDQDNFESYLTHLDPCLQHLLGNLQSQEVDVDFWVAALQSRIVETASDSLVKDGIGSYAVIFLAGDNEFRFQGPVDCHPSMIQSYQAELTGLLAIWILISCLKDYSKEEVETQ